MARSIRVWLPVIALLAAAVALGGCARGGAVPDALTGSWVVESFGAPQGLDAADPSVTSRITFEKGVASGNAGVNSFSGTYDASPGRLRFGPIAATEMAGPPAAMEQESRFLKALTDTRGFEVGGGKLVLTNLDNDTLVVLRVE